MTRRTKKNLLITIDTATIILAYIVSYLFFDPLLPISPTFFLYASCFMIVGYLLVASRFSVFWRIARAYSYQELFLLFGIISAVALAESCLTVFFSVKDYIMFISLAYLLIVSLILLGRVAWASLHSIQTKINTHQAKERTLIIGAGSGGKILLRTLRQSSTSVIQVVGLLDDDKKLKDAWLLGYPILGRLNELEPIIKARKIDRVIVAIPSLPKEKYLMIQQTLEASPVHLSSIPSVEELVLGNLSVTKLKPLVIPELLGRTEIVLDTHVICQQLHGKVILITGAGGSIGSEICRNVLRFEPRIIILLGHGENTIYTIQRELADLNNHNTEIISVIADIKDRERMFQVMQDYQPDIVYHAAAHKHVPLMENHPTEAVKNNIFGTKNVAEAAQAAGVENFVMISTDKAVNPTNTMGATKRVAEMIAMALNETSSTKFSAVRFGNVLGSRGSVIPLFKEQIKQGGPVTITDYRMTRYFMTIPEASQLVIQAGAMAKGGEIFVLDMGKPIKIMDLATRMIELSGFTTEEIKIVETGIRSGEKLHEELLDTQERTTRKVHDKIFVGKCHGYEQDELDHFLQLITEESIDLKQRLLQFCQQHHDGGEQGNEE